MKKLECGLIGNTLGHSLSPLIHSLLFKESKMDYEYDLYECKSEDKVFEVIDNLKYYNVTIPYKQTVFGYLNEFDKTAEMLKNVNCVCDNKGYNTDYYAFLASCKDFCSLDKVLLLGAGGVGRTIAHALGTDVTVAVRNLLSENILSLKKSLPNINVVELDKIELKHYNTIINATPIGMYPKISNCPINADIIKNCDAVYDTIYNPFETELLKTAKNENKNYKNGLEMLVLQAAYAHKIWYNGTFEKSVIDYIINQAKLALEVNIW